MENLLNFRPWNPDSSSQTEEKHIKLLITVRKRINKNCSSGFWFQCRSKLLLEKGAWYFRFISAARTGDFSGTSWWKGSFTVSWDVFVVCSCINNTRFIRRCPTSGCRWALMRLHGRNGFTPFCLTPGNYCSSSTWRHTRTPRVHLWSRTSAAFQLANRFRGELFQCGAEMEVRESIWGAFFSSLTGGTGSLFHNRSSHPAASGTGDVTRTRSRSPGQVSLLHKGKTSEFIAHVVCFSSIDRC